MMQSRSRTATPLSGPRSYYRPIATKKLIGQRPRRRPFWNSGESFFSDVAVFVLGAAGAYSVNLVGALPGDEILLIPMLPVLLLARGKRAFNREYLWFYILAAAWLLGTLIADVYAGTPLQSRMKGIARVVFFVVDFMVLAILINHKARRMAIFALSIVAVMLIDAREFQGDFLTAWKFGISSAVTIVALLASSYFYAKRNFRICIAVLLLLAALNLVYAFRSQIVVILVSAALTLPILPQSEAQKVGQGSRAQSPFKLVALLALAGFAAYFANQAVKFAANHGVFEESLSEKFQSQSEGKLGVLVGGRPETLVAIQAIRDSPIIGHGSFPYGPKYIQMKQDIQYEYGYSETDTAEEVEYPVIPTHSHLTMAWVESGILGGVLWIYLFALAIRAILKLASLQPPLAPLYGYLLVNFLWDILYSPFGSVNRLWGAYLVLLSYILLKPSVTEVHPAAIQRRTLVLPKLIAGRRLLSPS